MLVWRVVKGLPWRNAGLPSQRRIEFRVGIHLGDVVNDQRQVPRAQPASCWWPPGRPRQSPSCRRCRRLSGRDLPSLPVVFSNLGISEVASSFRRTLATVLSHDVEFLLAGLAAAETVGGVGERVFVQRARRRHGCGHSERRRRPRRHAHAVCECRGGRQRRRRGRRRSGMPRPPAPSSRRPRTFHAET
jgi:hypothetical protein